MASLDDTFLKRLEYWAQVARGVARAESREALISGVREYRATLRFARVTQWRGPARAKLDQPPRLLAGRRFSPRGLADLCAARRGRPTRQDGDVPDGRPVRLRGLLPKHVAADSPQNSTSPGRSRPRSATLRWTGSIRCRSLGSPTGWWPTPGPLRGKSHAMTLVRFLERLSPRPGGTNLARAAADWVRRGGRPGPVVVVGDLFHPGDLFRGLGILCEHGYGPHLVQVYDAAEAVASHVGGSRAARPGNRRISGPPPSPLAGGSDTVSSSRRTASPSGLSATATGSPISRSPPICPRSKDELCYAYSSANNLNSP